MKLGHVGYHTHGGMTSRGSVEGGDSHVGKCQNTTREEKHDAHAK